MNKIILLGFLLLWNISIHSQNLKPYFTIGNVGIDNLENGFNTNNGFVSLPGFHIRELDTGLGLSIESLKFNKAFTGENIYTSWFHSTLYWSPLKLNETVVLGPFIDVDFNFHGSFKIVSNAGVKFSLYHPVSSFFPEFRVSESIMLNSLNIITAYSLHDKGIFISISTDLSFLGLMFFNRQNEIAEERYLTR